MKKYLKGFIQHGRITIRIVYKERGPCDCVGGAYCPHV